MKGGYTTIGGQNNAFPETIWKIVVHSSDKSKKDYKENLDSLIFMYWKPVYAYIRYKWNKSNDDAKELTQQFFTIFLETDFLSNFNPEKGRFRSYVKASLNYFLTDNKRRESAFKRKGDAAQISISDVCEELFEGTGNTNPADSFDLAWAKTVLSKALSILRKKLEESGKQDYFTAFELFHEGDGVETKSRKEIAEKLKTTESNVKFYLSQSRDLLASILREEVTRSVLDPADVEDEMKYLLDKLGNQ
ncbi:MAG: sigma-70 family RNA polymerase sigma factor [Planctomycetes bacterium]|nr:sigma-70 family RNA polymerase sigma factor [Planctomycetota bacterium]